MLYKRFYKILSFFDNNLDRITDSILILLFFVGFYMFIDSKIVFDGVSPEKIQAYKPESTADARTLTDKYEDFVFWVEIPESDVSFPVVQAENNTEYLNKAPDGSYSLAGSIFLDSRNNPDLLDEYSIIYGHHMDKGMFQSLDPFEDKEFFDTHKEGYFLTKDGDWIDFEIVAFIRSTTSDNIIFNPNHPGDRIEYARENSINFREVSVDGEIVSLTTCVSPSSTDRSILMVAIKDRISNSD